jgi:hypothetical protein
MGKLPSWMKIVEYKDSNQVVDSAVVIIKIRRWHPSYWVFYWRVALNTALETRTPFHKWFPVVLYRFFFVNRDFVGDGVEIDHE